MLSDRQTGRESEDMEMEGGKIHADKGVKQTVH